MDDPCLTELDKLESKIRDHMAEFLHAAGMTDPELVGAAVQKAMRTLGNRVVIAGLTSISQGHYHSRIKSGMSVGQALLEPPHPLATGNSGPNHNFPKVALPGDVFGELTVVREAAKRTKNRRVIVRCSCGREEDTDVRNLTSWGRHRMCRHCRLIATGKAIVFHDGDTFAGRWLVVGDYEPGAQREVLIRCSKCGHERSCHGSRRFDNKGAGPSHCDCNPKPKKLAQPGDQFGQWTVLREGERDTSGERRVWCLCGDCGKEILVRVGNLTRGVTTRCLLCGIKERDRRLRERRKSYEPEEDF